MVNSEADCERLAVEDPAALIAAMTTMAPTLLTFAAEYLGRAPSGVAIPVLLPLLNHEKPYVREGALYGLSSHLHDEQVLAAVRRTRDEDPSPGVHQAALDVLFLHESPP